MELDLTAFGGLEIDGNLTPIGTVLCDHVGGSATCTEQAVCDICGFAYGDSLGHDMVTDAAKAPTCTETGLTEGSHCSRCDGATAAQEEIPALGHNWVDATYTAPKTCTVCGETEGEPLKKEEESNTETETEEDGESKVETENNVETNVEIESGENGGVGTDGSGENGGSGCFGGCGGSIGAQAVAVIAVIAAAGFTVIKKKED